MVWRLPQWKYRIGTDKQKASLIAAALLGDTILVNIQSSKIAIELIVIRTSNGQRFIIILQNAKGFPCHTIWFSPYFNNGIIFWGVFKYNIEMTNVAFPENNGISIFINYNGYCFPNFIIIKLQIFSLPVFLFWNKRIQSTKILYSLIFNYLNRAI